MISTCSIDHLRSPSIAKLIDGEFSFEWKLEDLEFDRPYSLADGFIQSGYYSFQAFLKLLIRLTQYFPKFSNLCARMLKELLVLQARWNILTRFSKLWFLNDMKNIILTCVILHNMIIQYSQSDAIESEMLDESSNIWNSELNGVSSLIHMKEPSQQKLSNFTRKAETTD